MKRFKEIKEKLDKKKEELQAQMQRGREKTEQMRAEKLRKKIDKAKYMEPGTFRYGLFHRQGILEFMKEVYKRRQEK